MASPLVPSKDALRALRSIVFSTPSAAVSIAGGVWCVANLHHDVGQRIRQVEKAIETKKTLSSISTGQGASRIAQLFEAAERGEDFLLVKGSHRRPKQKRVYSTQAQAVADSGDDYLPLSEPQPVAHAIQSRKGAFTKDDGLTAKSIDRHKPKRMPKNWPIDAEQHNLDRVRHTGPGRINGQGSKDKSIEDGVLGAIQTGADGFQPFFAFHDPQQDSRPRRSTVPTEASSSMTAEIPHQTRFQEKRTTSTDVQSGIERVFRRANKTPTPEMNIFTKPDEAAEHPELNREESQLVSSAGAKIMLATQQQHKPSNQKAFSRPGSGEISKIRERNKSAVDLIMLATQQQHKPSDSRDFNSTSLDPGKEKSALANPVDLWLKSDPEAAPVPFQPFHSSGPQNSSLSSLVAAASGMNLPLAAPWTTASGGQQLPYQQFRPFEPAMQQPVAIEAVTTLTRESDQQFRPYEPAMHKPVAIEAATTLIGEFGSDEAKDIYSHLISGNVYDQQLESIVGRATVLAYVERIHQRYRASGLQVAINTAREFIRENAARNDEIGWATVDLLHGLYLQCSPPVVLLRSESPIWHTLVRQLLRAHGDDDGNAKDDTSTTASHDGNGRQNRAAEFLFPRYETNQARYYMQPKFENSTAYLGKFYQDHPDEEMQVAETRKVLDAAHRQGYTDLEETVLPMLRMSCYNGHLDHAEVVNRAMVGYTDKPVTLRSIRVLLDAYADKNDWTNVQNVLDDYHHSGLSRTKPFSFAAVFASILERFVQKHISPRSFGFAAHAVSHLGLLPTQEITSVLFAKFIQNYRFEHIEKWLALLAGRFPGVIPVTKSWTGTLKIAEAWKLLNADCVAVDATCRALAYGSTRDVFSNSFRGIVRDSIEADLARRVDRARNSLSTTGASQRMQLGKHFDLDMVMNAAYEALQVSRWANIRVTEKHVIDDLKMQVQAVVRLNKLFGGGFIGIDEKLHLHWAEHPIKLPLDLSQGEKLRLGATGLRDKELRLPRDMRPGGSQRGSVVAYIKDLSLFEYDVPEALKSIRLPPQQEVKSLLEGYYKVRSETELPVDHLVLHVTARRMAEQGDHDGAVDLLSHFHASKWAQGTKGKGFHLDLYSAWLEFATQMRSCAWVGKIIWTILDYGRHLRLDTHFLLQVKFAQQRALREGPTSGSADDKEKIDREFVYLRWRLRFWRWQQQGGPAKLNVPKLSGFVEWEKSLYS